MALAYLFKGDAQKALYYAKVSIEVPYAAHPFDIMNIGWSPYDSIYTALVLGDFALARQGLGSRRTSGSELICHRLHLFLLQSYEKYNSLQKPMPLGQILVYKNREPKVDDYIVFNL